MMNLHACSDFPVYHTAFDVYDWMVNFGDPLFQRHVAGQHTILIVHKSFCYLVFLIDLKTITLLLKVQCYFSCGFLSCWNMGTSSPSPGWRFNSTFQFPHLCGSINGVNLLWVVLRTFFLKFPLYVKYGLLTFFLTDFVWWNWELLNYIILSWVWASWNKKCLSDTSQLL